MNTALPFSRLRLWVILAVVLVGGYSCTHYLEHTFRATYADINTLIHTTNPAPDFLKVHMKNGDVFVFVSGWRADSLGETIMGSASRFDYNRLFLDSGQVALSANQIAIIESNRPVESLDASYSSHLGLLTVVNVAVTVLCIANPKACFGSCPTFYSGPARSVHYADAEGFSSSVAPSLESGDIDALQHPPTLDRKGRYRLTMKNEAYETHAVNSVELLAVPCGVGQQIVQGGDDEFYAMTNISRASRTVAEEGDVQWLLRDFDGQERTSTTDSLDLQLRETLTLHFAGPQSGNAGVILGFRQSLLSTFLFYTSLSWMGHSVSDVFATIETNPMLRQSFSNTERLLGGIDLFVWNQRSNRWDSVGSLQESGPLARNMMVLPLGPAVAAGQDSVLVQLRMARGHWRLDYAAIGTVLGPRQPIALQPMEVTRNGSPDSLAVAQLSGDDRSYLASLPGDEFSLIFPAQSARGDRSENLNFFVRSKGYYLEWMRPAWNNPPQLGKLMAMVANNPTVWRELAVEFKGLEAGMEQTFWSSKAIQ